MATNTLDVVSQVVAAFDKRNRAATACGMILGSFMPVASYMVAHNEVRPIQSLADIVPPIMVLGGLAFSAYTVFHWARNAFDSTVKAAGFVLLVEGVMTFSHIGWLSLAALALLIAINGIATGCTLALRRAAANAAKREASRATRAPRKAPVAKLAVAK